VNKAYHKPLRGQSAEVFIESLTQDGRGVAHIDGKAIFIHGALPGETVRFTYNKIQKRFDEGTVQEILTAAPKRVLPKCPHFGICGGCSLQHLETTAQIQAKEQILRDALVHIGKVQPQSGYLPPLVAKHWGYRRKARLGVRYVERKGQLLVGFRERGSSFITNMQSCQVLHPKLGMHIIALRETLASLSICKQIPQVEMAMGDTSCILVIRVLAAPSTADRLKLSQFAYIHDMHIYLQTGGPQQVEPLDKTAHLGYSIPELGLSLEFEPLDFTQVHLELNQLLITRVLELLNPQNNSHILDLFCGIGNFTLPLATCSNRVVGVEGDAGLVARAKNNAVTNGLNNCEFFTTDLYKELDLTTAPWLQQTFSQIVLDPPRSGALQLLPHLPKLNAQQLLYISCLPATLARDAEILVHELGYTLDVAGVMDMFPHTAHVESIALFTRN